MALVVHSVLRFEDPVSGHLSAQKMGQEIMARTVRAPAARPKKRTPPRGQKMNPALGSKHEPGSEIIS